MHSGTELVRVRNALTLGPDLLDVADWAPPSMPPDFLQDSAPPDPYFVEVAGRLNLAGLTDDWSRGLAISRHLLGSAPVLSGGAIKKGLRDTHRAIVQSGEGYCGDFVRSYLALAGAGGLVARSWAFSFDGYGGHGHILVEIWNRQKQRWQLQDVFNNYYFVDGNDEPLSAHDFRRALASKSAELRLLPLHPVARPGYAVETKAWDYFRQGLNGWYMPWGNNVLTVDASPTGRRFSGVSRQLEQLGAIADGVYPSVRLLAEPGNTEERRSIHLLRSLLLGSVAVAVLGFALLSLALIRRLLAGRHA